MPSRILRGSLALALLACASAQDAEFDRALRLAKEQRWDAARRELESAALQWPGDPRFPRELAGIAYRQGDYRRARRLLHASLALDPHDSYTNQFLASLYFLDRNVEAGLKYGKPKIASVDAGSPLADRALVFASGDVLTLEAYRTSLIRLEALDAWQLPRIDVSARRDGSVDVAVHGVERKRWPQLVPLLAGLPFQSVRPELANVDGSGLHLRSLVRWDAQKRRLMTHLEAPLGRPAAWRHFYWVDVRRENWSIPGVDQFTFDFAEAGGGIESLPSAKLQWQSGAAWSYRDGLLGTRGPALAHRAAVQAELYHAPERRLTVASFARSEFGRMLGGTAQAWGRIDGGVAASWEPRVFHLRMAGRAGRASADAPFDSLFQLGIERDNDLPLRGHAGTSDGRKGSAPIGRGFALFSVEGDRTVYSTGLVRITAGPFVDTGKMLGGSIGTHARGWQTDVGAQLGIGVLGGARFLISYGLDLRNGGGAFYVTLARGGRTAGSIVPAY